jgi:hypothetical protein
MVCFSGDSSGLQATEKWASIRRTSAPGPLLALPKGSVRRQLPGKLLPGLKPAVTSTSFSGLRATAQAIDALARKRSPRVVIVGMTAANDLGLTDSLPARIGVLTN